VGSPQRGNQRTWSLLASISFLWGLCSSGIPAFARGMVLFYDGTPLDIRVVHLAKKNDTRTEGPSGWPRERFGDRYLARVVPRYKIISSIVSCLWLYQRQPFLKPIVIANNINTGTRTNCVGVARRKCTVACRVRWGVNEVASTVVLKLSRSGGGKLKG
jgi:hypothetical protein